LPLLREDVIAAAVEEATTAVLDALRRGDAPTPDALRLLLRAYAATGREDVREAIEPALAIALEMAADTSSAGAGGWLMLFAEAADASDDARLRDVASNLALTVCMNWQAAQPIAVRAESVDAYLRALRVVGGASVQASIDELERLVGDAYEPGGGIAGAVEQEIAVASALLTAFAVTDRLPYAMLAEELLRHAHSTLLSAASLPFSTVCAAAAALSRMGALHQLPEYRTAAVVAPDADYAADAARMLEQIAPDVHTHGLAAAPYGLAAGELQSAFR
jgi:hypothetical protein